MSSFNTLLETLGAKRSLHLLKRAYGGDLVFDAEDEERGQLRGINGTRYLTGSMSLLTCISYLALVDTHEVLVKQANLKVINDIKQVGHLTLSSTNNNVSQLYSHNTVCFWLIK